MIWARCGTSSGTFFASAAARRRHHASQLRSDIETLLLPGVHSRNMPQLWKPIIDYAHAGSEQHDMSDVSPLKGGFIQYHRVCLSWSALYVKLSAARGAVGLSSAITSLNGIAADFACSAHLQEQHAFHAMKARHLPNTTTTSARPHTNHYHVRVQVMNCIFRSSAADSHLSPVRMQ